MSLFGLDEIYNELLLEAKSPEEIKKILEYQFVKGKGVPQNVLDRIFEMDPTKKKTYTKWVLMQWDVEKENILESLKDGRISDMFNYFKERSNNGLNLLDMKSFQKAMDVVPFEEKDPIFGPIPDAEKDAPENQYEIVFDSPEWRIAVPKTYEADKKLGQGCKWCTAGAFGNGQSYFDTYTERGPLWVNFDKRKKQMGPVDRIEYPYTRYQFCFESGTRGEMCDAYDERIDIEKMDIPKDVFDFYNSKDPYYGDILSDDYDDDKIWREYEAQRLEDCPFRLPSVSNGPTLMLLRSYNLFEPIVDENHPFEMYTDDDTHDSIDYIPYSGGADDIYDDCDGFPMVVMSQRDDDRMFLNVYYENVNSYNRWSTETNVSCFGKNEYGCFFANEGNSTLYFVLGPNPNDIIANKELYDLSEVEFLYDDFIPSDIYNGIWIKVKYENGFYGIFTMDNTTRILKPIIKKDKPLNGEDFFVKKNERGYYIEGLIGKYWISANNSEDEDEENKLEIIELIDESDEKNILLVKDTDSEMYGLYDIAKKELFVKDALHITPYFDYVRITDNATNLKFLYDFRKRQRVTKPFKNGAPIMGTNNSFFMYNPIDDPNAVYFYEVINETVHGPFGGIRMVFPKGECVAVKPLESNDRHSFKLYDVDKKNYVFDDVFVYMDQLNKFLVSLDTDDGKSFIFDLEKKIKICETYYESPIKLLNDNEMYDNEKVYSYNTVDGLYNMVSKRRGVILPENVEYIKRFEKNKKLYQVGKNNKTFFIYLSYNARTEILPSLYGIDSQYIANTYVSNEGNNTNLIIYLNFSAVESYVVKYNVEFRKIINIENGTAFNREKVEDADTIKKIESILFPNKAKISEQFKNIMDRMNNL